MRLLRNIGILLVVLGLLIGGYLWMKHKPPTPDPSAVKSTSVRAVDLKQEQMNEVSVQNSEGTYTYKKSGNVWSTVSPADFKADTARIDDLVRGISGLYAEKLVDDNASDLAQYGFEKPTAIISVTMTDGSVKAYEVGIKTVSSDGSYFREKDTRRIYIIAETDTTKIISYKKAMVSGGGEAPEVLEP